MEIRVSSESEKKLVEKFLSYLGDSGVETLQADDHDPKYSTGITDDEYEFIRCNMPRVVVDTKEYPMMYDDYICKGNCHICGTELEGTDDGSDVSYDEYLDYIRASKDGELYCEKCWRKETGNT